MKLVIGNRNYSSWSLRAWLMLSAYDLTFEEIRIPLSRAGTGDEIRRYSGAGKVPVLVDGDLIIWDSLAIGEYLSEQYLAGRGWPADVAARAMARSAAAEMHSGFFALRAALPMNCRATGRRVSIDAATQRDIDRIAALWGELRATWAQSGPWLCGGFSIVDCMYAPVVLRFHSYGIELNPTCRAYMDALRAHPKMQHWLQLAAAETEVIEDEEVGSPSPTA